MSELKNIPNLISGLEEELEWFRKQQNPMNAREHRVTRILLTLAKSIQELAQSAAPEEGEK